MAAVVNRRAALVLMGAASVIAAGLLAAGPGRDPVPEGEASRLIVVLHTSQLQASTDNDGTVTTVRMQEHLCGQLVENLYFKCSP